MANEESTPPPNPNLMATAASYDSAATVLAGVQVAPKTVPQLDPVARRGLQFLRDRVAHMTQCFDAVLAGQPWPDDGVNYLPHLIEEARHTAQNTRHVAQEIGRRGVQ